MKHKHVIRLLSLAICAAASSAALAQSSGTITINGMITDTSCAVNITGPSVNTNVIPLQNAAVSDLGTIGATAKPENFTFELTGCPATSTGVWAHFYGTNVNPGGRLNDTLSVPDPATGRTNVSFQLLDGAAPITAGGTASSTGPSATQGTAVPDAAFVGGAANKTYTVRYYAEVGLTNADIGPVSSLVLYNLHYL